MEPLQKRSRLERALAAGVDSQHALEVPEGTKSKTDSHSAATLGPFAHLL